MKFGLFTGLTGITWTQLQELWQHIEATGWDAACVTDHFMPNAQDPDLERPLRSGGTRPRGSHPIPCAQPRSASSR